MKISSLLYLIIPILLSSCSHHYYIPNVQNVPLFREKNEFRISASGGTSGSSDSSFEVQTAYAITKNIGIMANYMTASENYTTSTHTAEEDIKATAPDFGKEKFIEGAIGYYKPLNENNVFEIYGGYGGGRQSHQYVHKVSESDARIGTSNLSYYRLFIQPSWGHKTEDFEFAVSTRFSDLFYNHFRFTNLYYDASQREDNYDLGTFLNTSHFLIEPAVTMRFGLENIKFQLQYLYSIPIDSSDNTYIVNNHISISLCFQI